MQRENELIRTRKPQHGEPIHLNLEEPRIILLDNGIELYSLNSGKEEVARIDLIVKAGSAYQSKKLVATTTGKLLKNGTKSLSSIDIATLIDEHGAYLDISVTKDTAIISLFSLNKHLDKILPLIGEMIIDAQFSQQELSIHIERQRHEFLTNYEKVKYRALLEFNRLVFGQGSAYGQQLQKEDFDVLGKEDILDFFEKYYMPENAYIIISGKVDDNVIKSINNTLGNGWSSKSSNLIEPIFTSSPSLRLMHIKKEKALQSAIRIGRPIVGKTHPDYSSFILLNTILGGYFGSRLMSNLREDKGFTYGISSFVANYIHAGYFSISAEVNADHTEFALAEIKNELRLLREQKVPDEELTLVKNYIYGTFLRNFDGPFALAERYRSVKDFGLNFAFYHDSLEKILKTSADNLLEIAQKYLDPEDMVQLIVGRMN